MTGSIRGRAARLLLRAVVIVGFGLLPGSVLRPFAFERVVAPLPPSPDRDLELSVTVRSAQADAPIVHARVRALAMVSDVALLAGSGETDETGRVRITSLPHAVVWIVADADGFARGSTTRALTERGGTVELSLGRAHTLEVAVADDLGKPVEGAEIEASGGDPLPVGARTGADGRAHLSRLGEGPWIVKAHAAGFEDAVKRGATDGEAVTLALRKLGALHVSVARPDGKPASLAEVQIAGSSLWPARVAHTAEDGTIRIGGLSAGSYAIRATSGEMASEAELGLLLTRGEEKEVTLTLRPGMFASVRAVDGDDEDEPVSHARVTLVEGGVSPFPLEGLTDEDGAARIGPIAVGPATLLAEADGYVPTGAVDASQGGATVTLRMVKGGAIEGRVTDARGRPIDGATIEIVGSSLAGAPIDDDPRNRAFQRAEFDMNLSGIRPLIPSGELGVVPGPVPGIPHASGLALAPTGAPSLAEPWVTKEDGTYRASPASPGRIRVVSHHPEFLDGLSDALTLLPGGEAHVDLVLHEGGALDGRVVDTAGRPVSGATVTMAALRGSIEKSTRSATDGTFAFAAVPDGVVVTASLGDEDLRVARGTVAVPDGGKGSITLTMPDARPALSIHVRDDRGYPVGAAQVSIGSVDPAIPLRTTVFTDAHGDAAAPGAGGVALRVEVTAPGFARAVVALAASDTSADVTLAPAASVTGDVRESRSGAPIRGALVTLSEPTGVSRTETGADGRFTLADVASGDGTLRVKAAGRVTDERDVHVEARSQGVDVGHVDLGEEGTIEGVVTDPRGSPVAGARVGKGPVPTYVVATGRDSSYATTDSRGRFHLGGLGDGGVTLEAYAPDVGRGTSAPVAVSSGRATKGVSIVLEPESGDRATEPAASGGVAVTLGELSGDPPEVTVVSVAEASEAERAGLASGDVLVAIDGVEVHTIADARARLAGPSSEDVVIVRRRGQTTEPLRVPRERVRR